MTNNSLYNMMKIIKDMEEYEKYSKPQDSGYKTMERVQMKRFRCGKVGHKKIDCRVKLDGEINNFRGKDVELDERNVKRKDFEYRILWDMGATHSVIGKGLVKILNIRKEDIKCQEMNFRTIGGEIVKSE